MTCKRKRDKTVKKGERKRRHVFLCPVSSRSRDRFVLGLISYSTVFYDLEILTIYLGKNVAPLNLFPSKEKERVPFSTLFGDKSRKWSLWVERPMKEERD